MFSTPKPFPIPLVALGPGSQAEEEPLDFMPMPRDMNTYRAPPLPEPQALASHTAALAALHEALAVLQRQLQGEALRTVDITHFADADRQLINQVLGEGEVSVQVTGDNGIQAQESVFAGIWRVLAREGGVVVRDCIEVGPFPQEAAAAARHDGQPMPPLPAVHPDGTMNAPAVLEELRDRSLAWLADPEGRASHVINLSLLPLSAGDSAHLDGQLGAGRVQILSRGYGNCRIVSTRLPRTWRVTYYDARDMVILDTLEVAAVPDVACATREDLEDSAARLAEVLDWVGAS